MTEREQEISVVMDLIWGMCENANMGIVPKQDKNGTWRVAVFDATTGKEYFMVRQQIPQGNTINM